MSGEASAEEASATITEVIPTKGLLYTEFKDFREVFCKPKIMPLKSATLRRLEELEKVAAGVGTSESEDTLGT